MRKVFADLLARPGQFPRKNSLAVLTEVHLGPCVYAGLTPKCGHKLRPLAAGKAERICPCVCPPCTLLSFSRREDKRRKIERAFFSPVCERPISPATFPTNHLLVTRAREAATISVFSLGRSESKQFFQTLQRSIAHCILIYVESEIILSLTRAYSTRLQLSTSIGHVISDNGHVILDRTLTFPSSFGINNLLTDDSRRDLRARKNKCTISAASFSFCVARRFNDHFYSARRRRGKQ